MKTLYSRSRTALRTLAQSRDQLWHWHVLGLALLALQLVTPVRAAGSDMPWEEPLQQVLDSIQGPVARIVAVIIIISTGLALAFGDTSGGFRKLVQIVFGLSIAFAASSFFLTFFSFTGGAMVMSA
jgi:type IV secretion system protein VirB2